MKPTLEHFKKYEQGISFWVVLPWLIAVALACCLLVFWLFAKVDDKAVAIKNTATPTPIIEQSVSTATPVISYKNAVNRAAKSVVNIYTTQTIQHPYMNDPAFREFFERYYGNQMQQQGSNLGSGVIVSKDGYIVTNAHVISKADEIIVALNDGRKTHAKVIGSDEESDLAVIKVNLNGLEPLAFRSTPVSVGDVALAIGNPFGVGQTVTQGIVSALGRAGLGVSVFEDFIQTDAAINPGNSGGALVDAGGALIGINTAIYSRSGGSMGIGFAIPNTIVERVMNALIKDGKVSRGWLGVGIAQSNHSPLSLESAQGVIVSQVWEDTPAHRAGLRVGDIITDLDGIPTNDINTLTGIVAKHTPNTKLDAQILRDGKSLKISITLGERPSIQQ
ncbi:trypsin-like peptidase domain-containing protein [Moraxella sp. ZY200743]|uniref:trypsin-like peptidase domain-containing protein n=1 Tax=Moraxella sp. ZY200743 TaxID=2911970 RepID=UPI003D7E665F